MQWASPYLSREDSLNNILCTACVGDVGGGARFIEDDARHERRWVEEGEVAVDATKAAQLRHLVEGDKVGRGMTTQPRQRVFGHAQVEIR